MRKQKLPSPRARSLNKKYQDSRIDTPQNCERLVEKEELIDAIGGLACTCVEPRHGKPNVHHLYWYSSDYNSWLAGAFREISYHKIKIERCQHQYVHDITVPPRKPDEKVMQYHVDYWIANVGKLILEDPAIGLSKRDVKIWDQLIPSYLLLNEHERKSRAMKRNTGKRLSDPRYQGSSLVFSSIESLVNRFDGDLDRKAGEILVRGSVELYEESPLVEAAA